MTRFEELDAPAAAVVHVRGRVMPAAGSRPASLLPEGGPVDPTPTMDRFFWVVVTAALAVMLALVLGDDVPWILVVPGLTALCGAWLDRRIPFSFAEGFIGYGGDPEPARGVLEDDWPSGGQWGAPSTP